MADVVFYEKPGCSGNAQQKKLLAASGHTVMARDLKREPWTRVRLLSFLAGLPVSDWFNRNAPAIKAGQIIPEELDEIAALTLLIQQPLLIRRPLLEVGDERRVGFDVATIAAWIGLKGDIPDGNLEVCAHGPDHHCGPNEKEVSFAQTGSGGAMPCNVMPAPDEHACRCRK